MFFFNLNWNFDAEQMMVHGLIFPKAVWNEENISLLALLSAFKGQNSVLFRLAWCYI